MKTDEAGKLLLEKTFDRSFAGGKAAGSAGLGNCRGCLTAGRCNRAYAAGIVTTAAAAATAGHRDCRKQANKAQTFHVVTGNANQNS